MSYNARINADVWPTDSQREFCGSFKVAARTVAQAEKLIEQDRPIHWKGRNLWVVNRGIPQKVWLYRTNIERMERIK